MKYIQNTCIPLFQCLFVCLFLLNIGLSAQERIQPNRGYQSRDTIASPLYGIKLVLPEHWNGFLTMGTEVFTLQSDTALGTSIVMFPSDENLNQTKARWDKGVEFSPRIDLIPTEPPQIKDGKLNSQFIISGDESQYGYALAQCGDFGYCYTAFLVIDKSDAPYYRDVLDKLSSYISFFEPTLTDIYGDYDWSDELKGKYLVTYESIGYSVKQNHLWLCDDGTFEARIKRKGGFKGTTGKYRGKLKGTYEIEGIGATGKILLNFDKLPPLELLLEVKEETVYMDGLRYSISLHSQCK